MPLLTSPDELANKTFDYVVVGAGGSGATLASRLTEDPNVNVLLLEAGGILYDDPMVDIPAQFGATFLNPKYDWGFPVVKQACSNNVEHVWPRGRGLGGSTTMNFLCWIKPPVKDVDAFEKLGNPGWNWADFQKYSLRAETFVPAGKEITDAYPHTYNEKFRGTSGPVVVTDPIHAHTADKIFIDTLVNKGVRVIEDPYGGDVTGAYLASNNVDPRTWKRTHSASAYLRPFEDRQNMNVLPNAFVTRIIWADEKDADGNLVATGVEYTFGEQTLIAAATKEVILSAGAIKSPHILEFSGVGKPDVLQKIRVDIKLDLPGVGENVQEHHFANVVFQLDETKAEHKTLDLLFNPEFAKESIRLHAEGKGTHRTGITAFAFLPLTSRAPEETSAAINELERDIKARIAKGEIPPALAKQYELQLEALKDNTHPDMELIAFPGYFMAREVPTPEKRFLSILIMLNHPISRGSIHAKSSNPKDHPEIIANYFKEDFDIKVLIEHVKFVRSLTETEPFKSNCKEVQPGPACATDEQIADYIKSIHTTTFHTIASCSMLPREDGGVVDPKLKVYGTKNLRVVDLSIVPLQVAAHTQTLAYAIGEKAADIIKGVL